MAINIIKPGKETFKAICQICGCEFTYQTEDLKEDIFHNHYIECPNCKNSISHNYEAKKREITWQKFIETTPEVDKALNTNATFWPDCDQCPNKPADMSYVGDSPCTFCVKHQIYCS